MSRATDGHPHWGVSQTRSPRALGLLRSLPLMASPCATWRLPLVNLGSEMNMYPAPLPLSSSIYFTKFQKPSNVPPQGSARSMSNVKGGQSCQWFNLDKTCHSVHWAALPYEHNAAARFLKLASLILSLCFPPEGMPPQACKGCRAKQKEHISKLSYLSSPKRTSTPANSEPHVGQCAHLLVSFSGE